MRLAMSLVLFYAALLPAQQFKVVSDPEDLLVVVKDGRYGYIDHRGKIVVRPQFIWGSEFYKGFATVYVCGRYVSVDALGRILPLRYAEAGELSPQRRGNKVGFVDAEGQLRIPPNFNDALSFAEGLAAVEIGDKWGFIDTSGHLVIQPKFKAAYYFWEGGVGTVESDGGTELIDKTGRTLASGMEFPVPIAEGRVPATPTQGGLWGYLDLQGRTIIPFVYEQVRKFAQGLAAVQKGGKWGYINRDGQVVIPFQFDWAGDFGKGLAPVKRGRETDFINSAGKVVFHFPFSWSPGFNYSDPSPFGTEDKRFGYVNSSGKVIWGPTLGTPDHAPITGWSEQGKMRSCEGISRALRERVAKFPADKE